jgi:hypothetical protein
MFAARTRARALAGPGRAVQAGEKGLHRYLAQFELIF